MILKISLLVCLVNLVAPWTVDLPDVRRYFFSKYSNSNISKSDDAATNDTYIYDNIHSNSKYANYELRTNNEHVEKPGEYGVGEDYNNDVYEKYAEDYDYQGYMEKRVHDVVRNGSVYLEGLRRALDNFTRAVEACNQTESGSTTWRPQTEANTTSGNLTRCEQAARAREPVRRLAELAAHTAGLLQDTVYANEYQKLNKEEEYEQITRLAWFLDRLAYYTGYEPDASDFLPPEPTPPPSTARPTPISVYSLPASVRDAITRCMNASGGDVAERCSVQLPATSELPLVNTDFMSTAAPATSADPAPSPDEILTPAENRRDARRRPKRSTEDPLAKIMNYYFKYKIWEASNPITKDFNNDAFNTNSDVVQNELKLKHVEKRSIFNKKSINHLPEDPFQDLSDYVKHKPGVHYVDDVKTAKEIQDYIEKMKHNGISKKTFIKKLNKESDNDHTIEKRTAENDNRLQYDEYFRNHFDYEPNLNQNRQKSNTDDRLRESYAYNRIPTHITDPKLYQIAQKPHAYTDQRNYYENHEKEHLKNLINIPDLQKPYDIKHEDRKHSIYGYTRMVQPRPAENPMKDISYYVKNKSGTNYNPSVAQAAQVRLGLEQVFATGPLPVVQRYGSNYNPAVPAPLIAGVIQSFFGDI